VLSCSSIPVYDNYAYIIFIPVFFHTLPFEKIRHETNSDGCLVPVLRNERGLNECGYSRPTQKTTWTPQNGYSGDSEFIKHKAS
jgi:hypothetical protein